MAGLILQLEIYLDILDLKETLNEDDILGYISFYSPGLFKFIKEDN